MKKIIDVKSMLIGFLLAASVMLFMGATSDNNGNGRYQGFDLGKHVYMINTQDGQLFKLDTGNCKCSHCIDIKLYGTKKWTQASKGFIED